MRFLLEQTPAETTAYRFARLDMKHFSPAAGRFVRGNLSRGELYYTNSAQLNCSAAVEPMEKIKIEGRFHSYFNAGAATKIWLGEDFSAKDMTARLIERVFKETLCNQIIFSPEFTACTACSSVTKGLKEFCVHCGHNEVDGIARITQYFSKTTSWNKGKLAELKDRKRIGNI